MLSEQQQRIMGYFIEEAKDHLSTIEQGLLNLKGTLDDPEMANEVFRAAHSVKGGAAMLGLTSIQHTAHRLEDYFKVLKECAVQIDQKLETLLLRVYDTLQDLVEQLQGPFGLTDDKAEEAMAAVEPVFIELNQHLGQLVSQTGARTPEDVDLTVAPVQAAAPSTPTEESALRLIFQNDVPARLREMLQVFKQPDTVETRQQLQSLCQTLAQPGDQLDLPDWCSLLATTEQAIANSDNNYRTLAPVVIKEIKRAQDLVLAGRAGDITASDDLLSLVPADALGDGWIDQSVTDTDLADLLGQEPSSDLEGGLITDLGDGSDVSFDLFGSSAAGLNSDLGAADLDDLDSLDLEQADLGAESDFGQFDVDSSDNLLFEQAFAESNLASALSSNQQAGPEMGPTELNSLADLFEGEESDLNLNWQEEILEGAGDGEAESLDLDASSDFSDLLNTDGSADLTPSNSEDLSSLLDSSLLDNGLLDDAAASSDQNELDLGDLSDLNSPSDLAAGGNQTDSFMFDMTTSGPTLDLDAGLGDDLSDSAADTELDFFTAMQSDATGSPMTPGEAASGDLDTLFADAEPSWEMPSTGSAPEADLDAFDLPELSTLPGPGFDLMADSAEGLQAADDELAFDLNAPEHDLELNASADAFDQSFDLAGTELDSLNLGDGLGESGLGESGLGESAPGESAPNELFDLSGFSDFSESNFSESNNAADSDLDLSLLDQVLPDPSAGPIANEFGEANSFEALSDLEPSESTLATSDFLGSELDQLDGFGEQDRLEPVQLDESGRIADWESSDLAGNHLDGLDVNLDGWAMDGLTDDLDLDDLSAGDPSTEELSVENLAALSLDQSASTPDALGSTDLDLSALDFDGSNFDGSNFDGSNFDALALDAPDSGALALDAPGSDASNIALSPDAFYSENSAESSPPSFELAEPSAAELGADWGMEGLADSTSSLDQFGLDPATDTALDQAFGADLSAVSAEDELDLSAPDDASMADWTAESGAELGAELGAEPTATTEFDLANFEAADDGALAFEGLSNETDAAALELFGQADLSADPLFESEPLPTSLDDPSLESSAADLENPFAVELPAASDAANLFEAEDANPSPEQVASPAELSEELFGSNDLAGSNGTGLGMAGLGAVGLGAVGLGLSELPDAPNAEFEPSADQDDNPFDLNQSFDLNQAFEFDEANPEARDGAGIASVDAAPEFGFDGPEGDRPEAAGSAVDPSDSNLPNNNLLESNFLEDDLTADSLPEDGLLGDGLLEDGLLENSLPEDGLPENSLPEDGLLENSLPEDGLLENSLPENALLENALLEETLLGDRGSEDDALNGFALGDSSESAFDAAGFEDAFETNLSDQGLQLESDFSEADRADEANALEQLPDLDAVGMDAGEFSFESEFSLDAPGAADFDLTAEQPALENADLDFDAALGQLTDESFPAAGLVAEPVAESDALEGLDLDAFSFEAAASDQPDFPEAGLDTELNFDLDSDANPGDLAAESTAELDWANLGLTQPDVDLAGSNFDEASLFASSELTSPELMSAESTGLDDLGFDQADPFADADLTESPDRTDSFLTDASLDPNSELSSADLTEFGGLGQDDSDLGDLFAEPSTGLDGSDLGFGLGVDAGDASAAFDDLNLGTDFEQLEQPDLASDAFNLGFDQPGAPDTPAASQEDNSDWNPDLFDLDSALDDAPAEGDFDLEAGLNDAEPSLQPEPSLLEDAALFGLGAVGLGAAAGALHQHQTHQPEPAAIESPDQDPGELGLEDLSFDDADFADLSTELHQSSTSSSSASSSLDGLDLEGLDDFAADDTSSLDLEAFGAEPADDAFSGLDDMLAEPPAQTVDLTAADAAISSAESDDFADLEALLGDDLEAETASPAASLVQPAGTPNFGASVAVSSSDIPTAMPAEDEFGDLEALLQDADQTLGGGSAVSRKSPAAINRRPNRRGGISDQTMRVSVKHLDNLNNLVGEMVVNRNTLEQAEERLRQFLDNLLYQVQQLSDVGQRMRDLYERSLLESSLLSGRRGSVFGTPTSGIVSTPSHATGASFDALEMDRFTGFHTLSQEMIELIVRVRESASDIDFVVEETDQVTRNFRQITTQLQEGLTRSRMVPFAQTADRLPRGVRDNSLKYGKQAELVIEGRDTLIDKMIVELLYDPMTHLVNNAIAHGIETPEERIAAGKSPTGRITIRAFHQGNQTVISVSDDGAGINPEKVRAKALAKKVITPTQAQEMTRLDTYDLLFHHGFSTADQVDDLRGRGVGLDVVRSNLSEIRGTINIDSTIGKGTTFTIRLPLTLSISKALCCISNRARIAFPMDGVEDMLDVPKERVQTDEQNRPCIQWRDTLLPFQSLSDLLRYNRVLGRGSVYGGNQEEDMISIVVLRSGNNFLALQVDQVLGEQEIVIKQLEGPVPKPLGVAGATVLGDGRIMPIADVLELIDLWEGRIRRDSGATSLWDMGDSQPPEPVTKTEPTVLIVDDSITVRELLSMTFNKVGYRVEQARDGQEAWEKLRSGLPCDLVFCDIEMPRMDGLELLSRIQKDPNLSHLPIAMLTSRGADRHRQMAVQLGAKGYFTKPYLEEMLLDAAQRMLKGEVMVNSTSTQ